MDIYIVYGECGEYSDHREWNVCALHDESEAEKLSSDLNTLVSFENDFYDRIQTEFEEAYEAAHPRPKYVTIPRVKATDEFRALQQSTRSGKSGSEVERARWLVVKAEHEARKAEESRLHAEQSEIMKAYGDLMWEARQAWVAENYKIPDEIAYLYNHRDVIKFEMDGNVIYRPERSVYRYCKLPIMDSL